MSYNPNRAANFNAPNQRKQYVPKPGDGIRHSDIMRRAGVGGLTLGAAALRTPTQFGYQSPIFEGKDFIVRFEVLFPGNSTALGSNKLADRHIRVCRGSVYVTFEQDKERIVQHIKVGGEFTATRGMKYALATSGSEEVELLVVESVGYEKNWKELEEAVVKGNGGVPAIVEPTVPVRTNRDSSKEKEYALSQAIERNKRVPAGPEKRPVSDASASVGVNLRPGGPGSFGE